MKKFVARMGSNWLTRSYHFEIHRQAIEVYNEGVLIVQPVRQDRKCTLRRVRVTVAAVGKHEVLLFKQFNP